MSERTFADVAFESKKRKTGRELFLDRLDSLVPWSELEDLIGPVYPTAGNGRRPYPLGKMLRVHVAQITHNLSAPAMEDALYDIESVRRFCGFALDGPLPDETTILNFRRRLEENGLAAKIFQRIIDHLAAKGVRLQQGTIGDATIIAAPSSTKNRAKKRDPEMRSAK